ncbi:MAG TPA: GerW family sporulation protein [Atribacteraceae bacterium]|nr:GerW family sporulation protein [Atribacteraceae bacterium]
MKKLFLFMLSVIMVLSLGAGTLAQETQSSAVTGMLDTILARITGLIKPDTLIGNPITVEGITFVPVIQASIGFGGGGGEGPVDTGYGAGAGAGLEMEPISFLIIKDGEVSLLSATKPPSPWVDIIMEFLPMIMQGMGDMTGMMIPDMMDMPEDPSWMFEDVPQEPADSLPPLGE